MGAAVSLVSDIADAPVTLSLIVGCVWVWSHVFLGALEPGLLSLSLHQAVKYNQWHRVVSSPFVHMSPWHLLINVMALWGCCSRVEIVFGSLFFLKYTVMLMFVEAFGTIALIQALVNLYRKRNRIYHTSVASLRAYNRLPETIARNATSLRNRFEDIYTNILAGSGWRSPRPRMPDHRGGRTANNIHEDEEAGMRETDRLTGGDASNDDDVGDRRSTGIGGSNNQSRDFFSSLWAYFSPTHPLERERNMDDDTNNTTNNDNDNDNDGFDEEEWDAEYEGTQRSSFAALTTHPMTQEPVMGFSSIILAWLAFIAMQWFYRGVTISAIDPTTTWLHVDHSYAKTSVGVSNGGGGGDGSSMNATVIEIGGGISATIHPPTDEVPKAFTRASMVTVPFLYAGFVPVSVTLAPLFFMFLSRLALHAHINTMAAHMRYALANAIMYPSGILLATDIFSFLGSWYWLICFAINITLLLLASILTNRKFFMNRNHSNTTFGALVRAVHLWELRPTSSHEHGSGTTRSGSGSGGGGGGGGGGDDGRRREGSRDEEDEEDEEDDDTENAENTSLLSPSNSNSNTIDEEQDEDDDDEDGNDDDDDDDDDDEDDDRRKGRGISYLLPRERWFDDGCEGRHITVYSCFHLRYDNAAAADCAAGGREREDNNDDDGDDEEEGEDGVFLGRRTSGDIEMASLSTERGTGTGTGTGTGRARRRS